MEELIRYIVKPLVNAPDKIVITLGEERNGMTVYNLLVDEADKGFVIGKQGRVAKAIRSIVRTAAMKENKKVHVDIL